MQLGPFLKSQRAKHKLTHAKVVAACGISQYQASMRWEQGLHVPSTRALVALSALYKLDLALLVKMASEATEASSAKS